MFSYTVIYAEDDIATQKIFSSVLSNYFTNVMVFTDGEKALNAIKTSTFDLLITDINMPNASGLDLAREVKKEILLPLLLLYQLIVIMIFFPK